MQITRYTGEHAAAVAAFNTRLRVGGSPFAVPTLPPTELEGFVAVDGASVRGAYFAKRQPFFVGGASVDVDHLQLPISEGSVDRRFAAVGVELLVHAERKHPLMYALGMGGLDKPLPRVLSRMGWRLFLVPFFFRVLRAAPFLRNIVPLRKTAARRRLADALAATGVGGALVQAVQLARTRPWLSHGHAASVVESLDDCADALWYAVRDRLSLAAVRDAPALRRLHPLDDERLIRLRVDGKRAPVGWAVLLATEMHGHKQFGDLRVGTVVDCLALPGHERAVAAAATRELERRDVALVVTNQQHESWRKAFAEAGFLRGPSNYAFGASRRLSAALLDEAAAARVHMTRGDGSGPIHL